jgi:hypothetical protein
MYIEKFVGPVVPADGEETTEPANVSAEGGEATLSPLEVRGISGAAVFLHCVGAEGGGICLVCTLLAQLCGGPLQLPTADALEQLVGVALEISKIPELLGVEAPTVIT